MLIVQVLNLALTPKKGVTDNARFGLGVLIPRFMELLNCLRTLVSAVTAKFVVKLLPLLTLAWAVNTGANAEVSARLALAEIIVWVVCVTTAASAAGLVLNRCSSAVNVDCDSSAGVICVVFITVAETVAVAVTDEVSALVLAA